MLERKYRVYGPHIYIDTHTQTHTHIHTKEVRKEQFANPRRTCHDSVLRYHTKTSIQSNSKWIV